MRTCPTCRNTFSDDMQFCPRDGARLTAASETEAQLAWGLAHRFRIVRRLGAGGMGTVFLAEQIAVGNRPVALKVLNRKLLDDPEFLLRFQNEAASTGRIRHPNVVTIYESGQADDGPPYIVMEYLEGETLRHALNARGALPVAECAEILQQVARGLNAAHKLGIIHRDLKPDNIFLTYPEDVGAPLVGAQGVGAGLVPALPVRIADAGRPQGPPLRPGLVKIVDFGIAKLRESATQTLAGTVLGTPAYMSYEQASGMRSDELDARSDIYSLGVVAYEMLTGRVPFHADTPLGYVRKHMTEEPPPFHTVNPALPVLPEVESVVMKALTKDREQRYGSAPEFASALAQAAVHAPRAMPPASVADRGAVQEPPSRRPVVPTRPLAMPPAPPAPQPQPAARPQPKRRLRTAILAALVVLVTGAVLLWVYWPRPRPKPAQTSQLSSLQQEWESATPIWPKPSDAAQVSLQGTRTVWENSKDGLRYVWIPPGTFMMGCSPGDNECDRAATGWDALPDVMGCSRGDSDCWGHEKPAHQVTITRGFWIGQTPVTAGAYKRFAGATGRQMPNPPDFNSGWTDENMPIVNVTWHDAQAYCGWVGGRLPTEAEWECAARGGSTEARYGPIDEVAWYEWNSAHQTHAVAQKRASRFGLYDMLGNVWEWVSDWYGGNYYQSSPPQDPQGPPSGQYRVLRGGSWNRSPQHVRVSVRYLNDPGHRNYVIGFRCGGEVGSP